MLVLQLDTWYAGAMSIRTAYLPIIKLITSCNICRYNPTPKRYRNPVIYARELQEEMIRDNLSRKQLAERHGVSSDRITQWLCLLKLPEERLREIEGIGDYWDKQIVTDRELRASEQDTYKTDVFAVAGSQAKDYILIVNGVDWI